ncbi:MAG: helix-hairpin-helix domain-containing protein [Ilumatobacter sp.]|uniref:ComEA family DNA-binding protein n=1 Tax=Ilumatobacter sp. TaxID=1967498 RepID=UPI002632269F|nr:helix-hairpin-helix domain-containing protein [Ilumatobacter sp.]MDJ0767830.1 helix-hairpin-helix domain-containing protein [Ilumatobacter sp.]
MSDSPTLPPRPEPPRRVADAATAWLAWFGPARLAVTVLSVLLVAAAGYWLVRAPAPPPEAALPVAAGSVPAVTLAPPVPVEPSSAGSAAASTVVVHVAGAVHAAGVHELSAGARVHAAIAAAGGATDDADLDGLNLAAPVVDGQRIYVPVHGEVDPATVSTGPVGDAGEASGPLDLNDATASQFETLPGVGPSTAAAIVDDRTRNGPFASVDELDRVPGIGPAKLAAIRDLVTV